MTAARIGPPITVTAPMTPFSIVPSAPTGSRASICWVTVTTRLGMAVMVCWTPWPALAKPTPMVTTSVIWLITHCLNAGNWRMSATVAAN
ncbi:hypothetical protein B5P44_24805 [Mycobacterium sp. CBMA 213]|nr:hypothetical protein [Mycolicibacterium sp. CBMA 213]